jgi:methionine synthase II (cobalamin-independent)
MTENGHGEASGELQSAKSKLARLKTWRFVATGTDCGLGDRVHPQLVWEKLKALREGADLAARALEIVP